MKYRAASFAAAFCFCAWFMPAVNSQVPSNPPGSSWRELSGAQTLSPGGEAYYYSYSLSNGSRAHVVVANIKSGQWRVVPFLGAKTGPTSRFAAEQDASAAINGGYFNLSDGESASFVVIDRKEVADPGENKALTGNPRLKPFLETIFQRSEIRFLLNKSGKETIAISPHNEPLPKGVQLIDSLQAGPALLPILRSEPEAFIRKEADGKKADSIGSQKPAARSAFGTTADGYAIFVAVSGKGQESGTVGVSLPELADLMKRLGCVQAINLDGGASTSLYVKLKTDNAVNSATGAAVCAKVPETRVRSILMLMPKKSPSRLPGRPGEPSLR